MIKIENVGTTGWEPAIRGMRNPKNSWELSDSVFEPTVILGNKDLILANTLCNSGSVHAKFRRMICVYADITAPLYWWKEFDTYKVGTVADSCSTMHKIHAKEFCWDDFSTDYLITEDDTDAVDSLGETITDIDGSLCNVTSQDCMALTIRLLNAYRDKYVETKNKKYWWQLIQLLPSSYNQKRTVMINYEVLANMYLWRRDHKLDEWRTFCKWVETLPYAKELITL